MQTPAPFFREAGSGPAVVCLHANASSSSQWRALMDSLAPDFHVLAADGYGAGRGPAWPTDRTIQLGDEVALLEPVFERAGDSFALVGHSYGGAVALIAAVNHPGRVGALALYEPTLFSIVDAESPPPNDADGIRNAVAASSAALNAGNRSDAARHFIDFWMGAGAWDATPEQRKGAIADSVVNARNWAQALMGEPTPLQAFAKLDIPVLVMIGSNSPAASKAVARLLVRTLPQVEVVEFEGLGHMGPITHAEIVNPVIREFLERATRARTPAAA